MSEPTFNTTVPCDCGYSNCDTCGPLVQAQHEAEIARMDRWNTLTDRERDDEIRKAM